MRKDIALPVLALAGGGACLALRRWQLAAALDPETELFRSVPATPVLIGVLALLALLFLVLIQGGGKPEDYPAAFRCPSSLYMTLVTAGACSCWPPRRWAPWAFSGRFSCGGTDWARDCP